jgi:hypothetical protein
MFQKNLKKIQKYIAVDSAVPLLNNFLRNTIEKTQMLKDIH